MQGYKNRYEQLSLIEFQPIFEVTKFRFDDMQGFALIYYYFYFIIKTQINRDLRRLSMEFIKKKKLMNYQIPVWYQGSC